MQGRTVDSSEMRAWGWSLTHGGMRALGAPAGPAPAGPLGPDDGTDDGAAAGGHQDERDSVQARRHGREGPDPGRVCATTGWHRHHARNALSQALTPRLVQPRAPRRPIYGAEIMPRWCPAGRCWAPRRGSGWPRSWPIWCPRCDVPGVGDHRRHRHGVAGDVAGHDGPRDSRRTGPSCSSGAGRTAGQNGGSSGSTRRPSVGVSVSSRLSVSESVDPS